MKSITLRAIPPRLLETSRVAYSGRNGTARSTLLEASGGCLKLRGLKSDRRIGMRLSTAGYERSGASFCCGYLPSA